MNSKKIIGSLLKMATYQKSLPPQLSTPLLASQDVTPFTATLVFSYPGSEQGVSLYLNVNGVDQGIQTSPYIVSGLIPNEDISASIVAKKLGYPNSVQATLDQETPNYDIKVLQEAQSQSLQVGDILVLKVIAVNATTYQWQKQTPDGFTNIAGATTATFTINAVDRSDRGIYKPVLSNKINTIDGGKATVTINRVAKALGELYNKNTWDDLSDFVLYNVNASLVGGKILVIPTGNGYNSSIGLKDASGLEQFKFTVRYQIGIIGGGSFTGIGPRSNNLHLPATVVTNLGFNSEGQASLTTLFSTYSNTIIASAGSTITGHSGDVIEQIYEQLNVNNARITQTNITAGSQSVTTATDPALDVSANEHYLSLFAIQGSVTIQSIKFESEALKDVLVAFKGDSKTHGSIASTRFLRYAYITGTALGSFTIQSGGGDTSDEGRATLAQTLLINAEVNIHAFSTNDIRFKGLTQRTINQMIANMQAEKVAIEAAGNQWLVMETFWETNQDVSSCVEAIRSAFPNNYIPVFDNAVGKTYRLSVDGIHPNNIGHAEYAADILATNKIQSALTY